MLQKFIASNKLEGGRRWETLVKLLTCLIRLSSWTCVSKHGFLWSCAIKVLPNMLMKKKCDAEVNYRTMGGQSFGLIGRSLDHLAPCTGLEQANVLFLYYFLDHWQVYSDIFLLCFHGLQKSACQLFPEPEMVSLIVQCNSTTRGYSSGFFFSEFANPVYLLKTTCCSGIWLT